HGGEALASRKAYAAMNEKNRRAVLDFLGSLVLYSTEQVPCDVDGDGKISERFMVAGRNTGIERLNPEWLFRVPGGVGGRGGGARGPRLTSVAGTTGAGASGRTLPYLRDTDRDGFPDVIDPAPRKTGYRDGEN